MEIGRSVGVGEGSAVLCCAVQIFCHYFLKNEFFSVFLMFLPGYTTQLKRRKDGNPFMDDDALEQQLTQEWKDEDMSELIEKEEKVTAAILPVSPHCMPAITAFSSLIIYNTKSHC